MHGANKKAKNKTRKTTKRNGCENVNYWKYLHSCFNWYEVICVIPLYLVLARAGIAGHSSFIVILSVSLVAV